MNSTAHFLARYSRARIPVAACVAIMGLTSVSVAFAHPRRGDHEQFDPTRARERMEQEFNELNQRAHLDTSQQQRIRAIMDDTLSKLGSLNQTGTAGVDRHRQVKQIFWAAEDRMHEVLSCDQREVYRKLRREHMQHWHEQHARPHQGGQTKAVQ